MFSLINEMTFTPSVTPTLNTRGLATLTGPKPPSSFKQNSSVGSCQDLEYILLYIIYTILLFYDTMVWVCLFSWPPDPTCAATPVSRGPAPSALRGTRNPGSGFCQAVRCRRSCLRLVSVVSDVCLSLAVTMWAGLNVKYGNCVFHPSGPAWFGSVQYGTYMGFFLGKKKKKDPLLFLFLLLSFPHTSDLVGFSLVVLFLVALLLLDIIQWWRYPGRHGHLSCTSHTGNSRQIKQISANPNVHV